MKMDERKTGTLKECAAVSALVVTMAVATMAVPENQCGRNLAVMTAGIGNTDTDAEALETPLAPMEEETIIETEPAATTKETHPMQELTCGRAGAIIGVESPAYPSAGAVASNMDAMLDAEELAKEILEEEKKKEEEIEKSWTNGYTQDKVNFRKEGNENASVIETLPVNTEIEYAKGQDTDDGWSHVRVNGKHGFIYHDYVFDEPKEIPKIQERPVLQWNGAALNPLRGTVQGPSGKETYYNLPMTNVITQKMGGSMSEYAVRSDGVKTFRGYVMVAANLNVHPRGSLVETTLGTGIVCDYCGSAYSYPNGAWIDIATTW